MPAQRLSPQQAYTISGSRFRIPHKVLSNKRALDAAFLQHDFNTHRDAQSLASGERRAEIKARGKGGEDGFDLDKIQKQAIEVAKKNLIDLSTEEGQQEYTRILQFLIQQSRDGTQGAQSAAGGIVGEPLNQARDIGANLGFQGAGPLPNVESGQMQLDEATARRLLKRAGGDKEKAREMALRLGYIL